MTITQMTAIQDTQAYHIDPTLYEGRPACCEGRLAKEIRTYDLLDRLGIPYQRLDHDAMPTIEACHEVDRMLGIEVCKNLFLTNAQKSKFYLLLMPGTKKFRTKDLMNDTENQVRLLIDKAVIEGHSYIGCHPCINTSSLRIKTAHLLERFLPAIHHGYTLVDLPEEVIPG